MKSSFVFVKPAGRQTRMGDIAWYDGSFRALIDNYFNTGDMTVYDSTRRILKMNREVSIDIDTPVDLPYAQRIAESFDCIVLRASNYIHESMNWGFFADWLQAIKLPVLCLGVGAQSAERRRIVLPAANKRVWQMISERSPSIGVRGEFTASVLAENGIYNSDIVGCPSIFRHLNAMPSLRHKAVADISRVGFSLRRETDHTYSSDVAEFLRLQKKILLRTNSLFNLVLTTHGEIEEKVYYYNDFEKFETARNILIKTGWFDLENISELEAIYTKQLFFSPVVSHYDEIVKKLDFAFGYRVHGVLPALAGGTPGFLLRYDTRSNELAETLKVPLVDPREALQAKFEDLFHKDRFTEFEGYYPIAYANMRDFLNKHSVSHNML